MDVDTVNTGVDTGRMTSAVKKRAQKISYHHGDLPRAMVGQAVRTIQRQGIHALTLRGVAGKLGVSRTALYRHFADKDDLLRAVAAEGFHLLQTELSDAWKNEGESAEGFDAMGRAYIAFAVRHPSHYRVMFGGTFRTEKAKATEPEGSGDAFATLVQAIESEQRAGRMRRDNSQELALYVWAVVHGVAMLAIDGILKTQAELENLTKLAIARLSSGIGVAK
ncbi:MAG: TetR/AcrR family transcriptional regulator [Myxococcaceae bacterium]